MSSPSTSDDQRRLVAVVHGRVQGVGFRYATQNHGQSLRLRGSVKNRSDGTVEVVAEGSSDGLDRLLAWLRQGPRMARVSHVDVQWQTALGNLPSFEVRF